VHIRLGCYGKPFDTSTIAKPSTQAWLWRRQLDMDIFVVWIDDRRLGPVYGTV
jgi:hypothetical protein